MELGNYSPKVGYFQTEVHGLSPQIETTRGLLSAHIAAGPSVQGISSILTYLEPQGTGEVTVSAGL